MSKSSGSASAGFATWNAHLGEIIGNLNNPHLPAQMRQAIDAIVPFDQMMIFGYRKRGRPLDLYNPGDGEYRRVIVQHYVAGSYLLDPFYQKFLAGPEARVYTLDEVKPLNFRKSEYNTSHYEWTGIFDELVFYVDLDRALTAAISITRSQSKTRFTAEEIETLNMMLPVLSAVVKYHWNGIEFPETVPGDARTLVSLQEHILHAFKVFGRSVLTKRETEVVSLILRGLSTHAIGEELGISAGTVKIHRRNAYQKLNISSQSELFNMFLNTLSDPTLQSEG